MQSVLENLEPPIFHCRYAAQTTYWAEQVRIKYHMRETRSKLFPSRANEQQPLTCARLVDNSKLEAVPFGGAQVEPGQTGMGCESHCFYPCIELNGDINRDCVNCSPEHLCNPASEGWDAWHMQYGLKDGAPKAQVEPGKTGNGCKSHCAYPCIELNGDINHDCINCSPEHRCNPKSEGWTAWHALRSEL